MPSDVTIVIASRDRRDRLLASLPYHHALPERPEVILVDDASSDGSADAVEAAFPEVRVIRRRTSGGGAARNDGIAAATTPYVALADDDSWYAPGALAHAATLLDADARLGLINAHVVVGRGERDDPTCVEMAQSPLPAAPGQPGHPLLSFIACGAIVRRSAVLEAGGFDARLGIGGEEELLAWDMAARGWLLSYVPEVIAHHHPPPNDGRPERRERGIRNTLWTTWLRRPVAAAARRTALQLVRLPPDRHTARALVSAVAGVPWLRRERRVLPAEVELRVRMLEDAQLRRRKYA
ncbi:MAG TPA: glycosyltransferase [Solirubrobacteraceae bacterium]|jgi:GT2 family glycosyltransferase|nr:glycosyltransferase [Solirubrobacteraceae bacterium]